MKDMFKDVLEAMLKAELDTHWLTPPTTRTKRRKTVATAIGKRRCIRNMAIFLSKCCGIGWASLSPSLSRKIKQTSKASKIKLPLCIPKGSAPGIFKTICRDYLALRSLRRSFPMSRIKLCPQLRDI